MGFDFHHENGGRFRFNMTLWPRVLQLAFNNGWEPEGTIPIHLNAETGQLEEGVREGGELDVDRDYLHNDRRIVTTQDARNLADALERALPDIPNHDAMGHKSHFLRATGKQDFDILFNDLFVGRVLDGRVLNEDAEASPVEMLSGQNKEKLQQFIAYAREGAFCIA